MAKKVQVKSYSRRKPTQKKKGDIPYVAPKEISDPQVRASEGVQIVGGGGNNFGKPELGKGVNVLKR